jgi:hypothetical protein
MKKYLSLASLTFLLSNPSRAQVAQQTDTPNSNIEAPAAAGTFSVVDRGPDHRVFERTEFSTNKLGHITEIKHAFTQLGTGMHFLRNGQYQETREEILMQPDGNGAAATNGPNQLFLPADIYQGVIKIIGPDGQTQRSRPMGIAYVQGSQSVLISSLTNSIGQILANNNQVLYTNSFTDFECDLLVTYRQRGIECDLIIRGKPPSPTEFGLDPNSCQVQLLTEFFDTQAPLQKNVQVDSASGITTADLEFGALKMRRGRAFSVDPASSDARVGTSSGTSSTYAGASSKPVRVQKSWEVLENRTFLIESASYRQIKPKLDELAALTKSASRMAGAGNLQKQVSTNRVLTSTRKPRRSERQFELARSDPAPQPGVVLDWEQVSGSTNSYVFQSDKTYVITNAFNVNIATFEGGTVIKEKLYGSISIGTSADCQTGPYRPAIFTSVNDNSVGETIPGSTGSPGYGDVAVNLGFYTTSGGPLSYLRFSHSSLAIDAYDSYPVPSLVDVWDCQFIDVAQIFLGLDLDLHNVLISQPATGLYYAIDSYANVYAENVTSDGKGVFILSEDTGGPAITLINCLVTQTNLMVLNSGEDHTTVATVATVHLPGGHPWQTIGGGTYYLATNSPYRNVGAAVSGQLSAELRKKTTYPPILLSNASFPALGTPLAPQAQRDTDEIDLGFHYDPLDFEFGAVVASNQVVTVLPGTAIATFGKSGLTYGIGLTYGSQFSFSGTAENPVLITEYNMVQESTPSGWLKTDLCMVGDVGGGSYSSLNCRFTYWYSPAQDCLFIPSFCGLPSNFQDCQFHGGQLVEYYASANLTNCLLNRVYAELQPWISPSFNVRNCLFYGGSCFIYPYTATATFKDNFFDHTSIYSDLTGFDVDYNAYVTNSSRLYPTNTHDLIITNTDFRVGPLGNYYYPTNGGMLSRLINAGSVSDAALVGLYHYTTTTNLVSGFQIKETNSIVDIGWHRPATDGSGQARDSDNDGTPDYLEDANNNGLVDSGETDWQSASDPGLKVIITRPRNDSTIPYPPPTPNTTWKQQSLFCLEDRRFRCFLSFALRLRLCFLVNQPHTPMVHSFTL